MLENANILDVSRTAARPHYEQAHRFYHTWDHIAQMFDVAARDALPLTLAQQLAIVWHDAVYVPGLDKGANERASALLMRDHMDRAGWLAHADGRTLADTVEGIIVSTIDHVPQLAEAELVLDLDLYRLGVDFDAFQQHADAVRQEYGPLIRARGNADEVWRTGRAAVYASFLARERIYYTPAMARYEAPARDNLRRGLAELRA